MGDPIVLYNMFIIEITACSNQPITYSDLSLNAALGRRRGHVLGQGGTFFLRRLVPKIQSWSLVSNGAFARLRNPRFIGTPVLSRDGGIQ